MLQSLFVCRRLLSGGTVIPVSLIAVVPTVLEKSVFYGYLAVASVSLGLPTQFVHCCLAATRAFMPASLIVIPHTILEISKFLSQRRRRRRRRRRKMSIEREYSLASLGIIHKVSNRVNLANSPPTQGFRYISGRRGMRNPLLSTTWLRFPSFPLLHTGREG